MEPSRRRATVGSASGVEQTADAKAFAIHVRELPRAEGLVSGGISGLPTHERDPGRRPGRRRIHRLAQPVKDFTAGFAGRYAILDGPFGTTVVPVIRAGPDARSGRPLADESPSRERMLRDMNLRPEDVFTPATPVQEDMFAARRHEDLEDRVASALSQPGRQIVLYGDTGVGKTSLVNHLLRKAHLRGERIECGPSFDEMLNEALSRVLVEEELEGKHETSGSIDAGLSVHVLKAGTSSTETSGRTTRPIPRSRQAIVIAALETAKVDVLFLDNFENVFDSEHQPQTIRSISQLLKSAADRTDPPGRHIKIVVAGIPTASEVLIELDEATARRVAQIEVLRMPRDELDQILVRGEKKLGISFEGIARNLILNYSDGFPYYTHLLALHASRRALSYGHTAVDLADFEGALQEALNDCILSLRLSYQHAVETSGSVRIRRSILEALASLNDTEVPFKAIREVFLARHPEYKALNRLNFLSTAVKPLKEEYGILSDRGLPKSKRNFYRFTNPLMRGYVRLRMRRDEPDQPMIWDPSQGLPGGIGA